MGPDFNLLTRNTFKTLHKHDTKTAENASPRFQIQMFLNLITFLDIQSNYPRILVVQGIPVIKWPGKFYFNVTNA